MTHRKPLFGKSLLSFAFLAASCAGGAASEDAGAGDLGVPFVPAMPSAYTAKVKNLLTGLSPTDAELQAVTADPHALSALIDTWMALPEFQGKMFGFFQQAFQQTQLSPLEFADQLQVNMTSWPGAEKARFLASAEASFARTALYFMNHGTPFTSTVTTDTFMLNPPLMAALALNDMLVYDDDGSFVPGNILSRFPGYSFTRTTAVVPYSQTLDPTSPNFMVFTDPKPYMGPNSSCQVYPFTIGSRTSAQLANAIAAMGARLFGGRPGCGSTTSLFTAEDYTSWRMVKIRRPDPGEPTTLPWDLPALRDPATTTLVLRTPRVGFMSTLAFNANWPTNQSNLARVTTNQTLIVALGRSLSDPEAAVPVTETGLPASSHAIPGTVCYGCHQLLDPMRNFFRQSYSVSYHQQTLALPADQQVAEYVYDGLDIKGAGNGIVDLAAALVQSPSYAPAWVQKLCQYANSSSCSVDDPEFLRIAQAFQRSNHDWKTLIRELFASPLVTAAAATRTAQVNGTLISVSRREHFCAALSNRLGITDACQLQQASETVAQDTAFGIPGSSYSRGTPSPLLPHDPDLFFYSGAENLCAQLAQQVIDPAKPCQSPQRCFSSAADPQQAAADFTTLLMALPPSDPRATAARQILLEHYQAAKQSGASAGAALQSTFTLACSSPFSEGSGL